MGFEEIPSPTKPLPRIEEMRIARPPFGKLSSLFLLLATLQYHLSYVHNSYRDTSERLQRSFYEDDLDIGGANLHEGMKLCKEANEIMSKAGMKTQKSTTNGHML